MLNPSSQILIIICCRSQILALCWCYSQVGTSKGQIQYPVMNSCAEHSALGLGICD